MTPSQDTLSPQGAGIHLQNIELSQWLKYGTISHLISHCRGVYSSLELRSSVTLDTAIVSFCDMARGRAEEKREWEESHALLPSSLC